MKQLLIVDDDEEMCLELSEILKREGFAVDTAFDGVRGWRCIESGRYELVILDLKLPGLNGYALLKNIRDSGQPVKVFVLSGRPLSGALVDHNKDYYKEEGGDILQMADAVMNKPFVVDLFLKKVRELTAS